MKFALIFSLNLQLTFHFVLPAAVGPVRRRLLRLRMVHLLVVLPPLELLQKIACPHRRASLRQLVQRSGFGLRSDLKENFCFKGP